MKAHCSALMLELLGNQQQKNTANENKSKLKSLNGLWSGVSNIFNNKEEERNDADCPSTVTDNRSDNTTSVVSESTESVTKPRVGNSFFDSAPEGQSIQIQ